jgi:hypothetical protein
MAELLAAHRDRIAALVGKSLDVIEESLTAGKFATTPSGYVLDLGADVFARLGGVKRLIEMVQAARSDALPESRQTITFEAFLHILREAET